jgi:pyridoxine 5-phosphate synthase
MSAPRLRLGVNIDHIATVRNARGGDLPDPVRGALSAIAAGADGVTAHLREDRRHIRDEDIARLMKAISKPLNFEMAVTDEMIGIALDTNPHAACLVPEKRSERTTEGGLDVIGGHDGVKAATSALKAAGIRVSLFIEPSSAALEAAKSIGSPVVELHTGAWCDAAMSGATDKAEHEFSRIRLAAAQAARLGIECHAGHGLDYVTARRIAALPQIVELNIGHFLMGEALFVGLPQAIATMRAAMDAGRAEA